MPKSKKKKNNNTDIKEEWLKTKNTQNVNLFMDGCDDGGNE